MKACTLVQNQQTSCELHMVAVAQNLLGHKAQSWVILQNVAVS